MLQAEVQQTRLEIGALEEAYNKEHQQVEEFSALLTDKTSIDPKQVTKILEFKKHYENIAGVEVPHFEDLTFEDVWYDLFDTPPWVDNVITGLRNLMKSFAKVQVAREKKKALEKELREVSIRVNLFEKILIPRASNNIKKIRVFLGDQQLNAVSQAKVAKNIIEENKKAKKLAAQDAL